MTEYQRITLKESGEEFVVGAMEYPYQQAGILYIKFIVYDEVFGTEDGWHNQPIKFLTVQPQDILKRGYEWSQEAQDELVAAAEEARERETVTREMYQAAAEADIKRRAEVNMPPDPEGGDQEGLLGLFG